MLVRGSYRPTNDAKFLKPILSIADETVTRALEIEGLRVVRIDPQSPLKKMEETFLATRPSMVLSVPGASQLDMQEYFWFLESIANTGIAVLHIDSQFNDRWRRIKDCLLYTSPSPRD